MTFQQLEKIQRELVFNNVCQSTECCLFRLWITKINVFVSTRMQHSTLQTKKTTKNYTWDEYYWVLMVLDIRVVSIVHRSNQKDWPGQKHLTMPCCQPDQPDSGRLVWDPSYLRVMYETDLSQLMQQVVRPLVDQSQESKPLPTEPGASKRRA